MTKKTKNDNDPEEVEVEVEVEAETEDAAIKAIANAIAQGIAGAFDRAQQEAKERERYASLPTDEKIRMAVADIKECVADAETDFKSSPTGLLQHVAGALFNFWTFVVEQDRSGDEEVVGPVKQFASMLLNELDVRWADPDCRYTTKGAWYVFGCLSEGRVPSKEEVLLVAASLDSDDRVI